MAIRNNFYLDAGSDFSTFVTIKGIEFGTFSLDGYEVKGRIARKPIFENGVPAINNDIYDDTTPPDVDPKDFVCTIYDVSRGIIRLYVSDKCTEKMKDGRWVYTVTIENETTSTTKRILQGLMIVNPQLPQNA